MKKVLIALLLTGALFIFIAPRPTYTTSAAPPPGKTGAPGENTCLECHLGGGGTGNVSIVFNNGLNLFVNEQTYPVTVTVTDAAQMRFGFEATVRDQNDTMSGVLSQINFTNTSLTPNAAFTKFYIGHANATTSNTWTFNWTAPPASFGSNQVTFYVAGNAANGNSENTGDHIYVNTVTVIRSAVGIEELSKGHITAYPEQDQLNVQVYLPEPANTTFRVFDLGGRLIHTQINMLDQGLQSISLPVNDLPGGIYLLNIAHGATQNSIRFFIN